MPLPVPAFSSNSSSSRASAWPSNPPRGLWRSGIAEQRRCAGFRRLQSHAQRVAPSGVEAGVPHQSVGQCRLDQVLRSATKRDEKMMIIRVAAGTPARKVSQYRDGAIFERNFQHCVLWLDGANVA